MFSLIDRLALGGPGAGEPDVTIPAAGACPVSGITADTNFFRSEWPTPGRVFDASALPGFPKGVPQLPVNKDYWNRPIVVYPGATSPGRHCRSTLSLTVIP
jgi:hypothetical protein